MLLQCSERSSEIEKEHFVLQCYYNVVNVVVNLK